MSQDSSAISGITAGSSQALTGRDRVLSAIRKASDRTGVDFSYLVAKATQESGLDANAKAAGSSATGLYQFIDQTWLKTVKAHGDEYGLSAYADKITIDGSGVARVSSTADKKAILALRTDPEIAAGMAAELAQENKASLQRTVGGKIGATELYMAHFLGAGGASSFLKTARVAPNARAADILPDAASANRNVFYDKNTGRARTVSEVYAFFNRKFDGIQDSSVRVASTAERDATGMANSLMASVAGLSPETQAYASGYKAAGSTFTGGIGPSSSTPFAAMVLAQMDMESLSLDALDMTSGYGAYATASKRSALSALAG